LQEELTAINQYFLHAEMCDAWGYERLSEYIKKQSIGEMKHAQARMERILFFGWFANDAASRFDGGKECSGDVAKRPGSGDNRSKGLQRGHSGGGGRERQRFREIYSLRS
jgi:Ferritin-like domain